jgi:diaminopimelate decarboxylase
VGVELGKKLAKQLHARQNHNDWAGVDASTQELMKRLMQVTEHHKQRQGSCFKPAQTALVCGKWG